MFLRDSYRSAKCHEKGRMRGRRVYSGGKRNKRGSACDIWGLCFEFPNQEQDEGRIR